jgi:hypothetical protein
LEEGIAPIIRVKSISELSIFLARCFFSPWWWRRYFLPKRRFLQDPHSVTSLNTAFFNMLESLGITDFKMAPNTSLVETNYFIVVNGRRVWRCWWRSWLSTREDGRSRKLRLSVKHCHKHTVN